MSAVGFRSVFMVASCAGAALSCYLVSLHVASERAALEQVESQIILAERDIRLLQTEIGTRGRLAQLERWNVKVLALSAPSADQFLDGGFQLASLMRPQPKIDAPVVLATVSSDTAHPQLAGSSEEEGSEPEGSAAEELLHVASLKRPVRGEGGAAVKPAPQAVEKKAGDKRSSRSSASMTKPAKTAKVDPLAPLPAAARSTKGKDADSVR